MSSEDSDSFYECECGQKIHNNPGAIATHKKGDKHKAQMSMRKQRNTMLQFLRPRASNSNSNNNNRSSDDAHTSSTNTSLLLPAINEDDEDADEPTNNEHLIEHLKAPLRKCHGVIPAAIQNPHKSLLCQLPLHEIAKINPRLFWISDTGIHHVDCMGVIEEPRPETETKMTPQHKDAQMDKDWIEMSPGDHLLKRLL